LGTFQGSAGKLAEPLLYQAVVTQQSVVVTLMAMALSDQSVVAVTNDQVSCKLGAESAILNVKEGIYYGLDSVGTQIWNLLQAPVKVATIREYLLQEYDVQPDRCLEDLLKLLEDLLKAGLIEVR
jgi:hypothetical protein